MGLISNGTTIFDSGAMAAGLGSSMTFIKKLTASSSLLYLLLMEQVLWSWIILTRNIYLFLIIFIATDDKCLQVTF